MTIRPRNQRSRRTQFFWLLSYVLMVLILAMATIPAHAKRLGQKVNLGVGVQAGSGYDSNVFNKKADPTRANLGEAAVKAKVDYAFLSRASLSGGAGFGTSLRVGENDAEALKLSPKANLGTQILLFGKTRLPGQKKIKKSEKSYPAGKIGLDFNYSGAFNPSLNNPVEDETTIDEEDEIEDILEDEGAFGDDDADAFEADFEDDGEGDVAEEDEDVEEEALADEEEDVFENEDPLGGKFFNSAPYRNVFGGSLRFTVLPISPTSITVSGKGAIGDVEERPGQVSSDYKQAGTGLTVNQQVIKKYLTVSGGYGYDMRFFDEKTVASGNKLKVDSHAFGFGAKIKPIKPLKLALGYKYGLRLVPESSTRDAWSHQIRAGLKYKLWKHFSFFQENSILLSGLQDNDTKDAIRYQGLAGIRWNL